MLVKILGLIDFFIAFILFTLSFGVDLPQSLILFAAIPIALKGGFILLGDIISVIDLIAALLLFISAYHSVPFIILVVVGFLEFQKGFFSLMA